MLLCCENIFKIIISVNLLKMGVWDETIKSK